MNRVINSFERIITPSPLSQLISKQGTKYEVLKSNMERN